MKAPIAIFVSTLPACRRRWSGRSSSRRRTWTRTTGRNSSATTMSSSRRIWPATSAKANASGSRSTTTTRPRRTKVGSSNLQRHRDKLFLGCISEAKATFCYYHSYFLHVGASRMRGELFCSWSGGRRVQGHISKKEETLFSRIKALSGAHVWAPLDRSVSCLLQMIFQQFCETVDT